MPQGTEQRHRFLGRKGELDIFAFDPLATALAKLARSRQPDIVDVLALIAAGQLRLDTLMAAFEEIMPRVEAGQALKITADEYRQKFAAFVALARRRDPANEKEEQ